MYLPKIVSGSDTQKRLRCKFERRVLACLLVPPGGCSCSCQDTSPTVADTPMPPRSSTELPAPPLQES